MIADIFGYAIVVALLVGLAAASVEQLLVELRRPRRFAWLGAFAAALASPPLFWLLAPEPQLPVAVRAGTLPQQPFAAYPQFDWNTTWLWLWIMVMFHPEISYADAQRRGAIQAQILGELTASIETLARVDFARAAVLVDLML